ncbi:Aberrant root formation protein 4, partial [Mucuna pruriens]
MSFGDSETRNNLRRILDSCSKLAEAGDFHESENRVSELVKFLDSLLDAAVSDSEHAENDAFDAISEIHLYICSPSLDQEVVDALSFELPKAVSKFVGISSRFLDMAINIIDQFIVKCGPRDMLSILCNTLGYSSKVTKAASYTVPALSGLSKVFVSIQRRQFEQVKEAVPIILNVLEAVSLESEEAEIEDVFDRAVEIAYSIYEVCNKLERDTKEKLQALLEDKDRYMDCLSHVKHGAGLSVIWGHVSEAVAHTAKEDLVAIKDELRNNRTKRWQAIGTLKHVLSFVNLPWELKKHAIDFLLCIIDRGVSGNYNEEHSESSSSYMPSLFLALQVVFTIAIFIDIVRKEMRTAMTTLKDAPLMDTEPILDTSFWNPNVLELVRLVLRPPRGGPPSLPEQSDAVLSALNLYRFILMTEAAGKTNYTDVLSRQCLLKVYNEWLLPLRTLVADFF